MRTISTSIRAAGDRRLVWAGSLFAGLVTALIAGAADTPDSRPATHPTTAPSATKPTPQAAALAAKLSSADWRERDKAQQSLIALGEDAVAALTDVQRNAPLDEARTAAAKALKQIAEDRLIGPSQITLHLSDVPAQKAFEELGRQSFAVLKPFPDTLWTDQAAGKKVTLDVERQPYWVVMRQLARDTGVEVGSINGEPRLIASEGQSSASRFAISGPFMVIATQIHRSQSIDLLQADAATEEDFNIQFSVLAEPKLKVLSATTIAKLDQVVDDHGNSLLPDKQIDLAGDEDFISPNFGAESSYSLSAWLKYPTKNPGRKIAKLRGSATFTVQVESEKLDVPLKSLRGTTRTFKGLPMTFGELQKVGDNWQLKISMAGNDQHPAWDDLQNSIMSQLKVVDSKGQPLDHHGFGSGGGGAGTEITVSFGTSHRPEDGRQSGEPARVVWEIPTKTRALQVPFEFKDLKMP
ncbi:hypothetical protein [Humisphaera borealis]|uniref:Uncharacterized protein n=1 Tax=Humisphaera borealis TaxID=2807512 RepID=A0A7M2WQQ5_9BACT|nr:hypothetical protein [Humisphaera borealis]QOV87739.1 hypothetical protein IPV69_15760 [Humisphaera borealis]